MIKYAIIIIINTNNLRFDYCMSVKQLLTLFSYQKKSYFIAKNYLFAIPY